MLIAELRRPRTLVGAASLAIGAMIVTNALFLQAGPHPSPLVATREASESGVPVSDSVVRSVQDALTQAGYYSGPLDGFAGPQTKAAILAFEEKTGREHTGVASLALLDAIRSEVSRDLAKNQAALDASPAAQSAAAPDASVEAVQRALDLSAYGPLQADGIFGPETREAIMRFQRDHNLAGHRRGQRRSLSIELRAAGALEAAMAAPRLRSDFWVAALRRRAEAAGAFISIARRGAEEAGAIFVIVDRSTGTSTSMARRRRASFTTRGRSTACSR